MDTTLTPNQLAFLALSNEYCRAVEGAPEADPEEFATAMCKLLPRLYISATDLADSDFPGESYLPASLTEDGYNAAARGVQQLMGEHDTYLEVFEEDMKFSDTPITASISEGLADIYQVLFNLIEASADAPAEVIDEYLQAVREDFAAYWSQTLCNTLRALNALKYAG